jgi:hypothetical protein
MNDTIIYPSYLRIFECRAGRWFIKNAEIFYQASKRVINHEDIATLYGITEQQVVIELFRICGGASGYYLANLRDKKYHYCGHSREDTKKKLLELGIGRLDPLES